MPRLVVEGPVGAERCCPSSRPLAAEAAHRRLRRDHAELERRLAVAVRELGALTEGMDGDGIPEDRREAALGCRVERVLEQPAEDTEAPIGGVDDCGTRFSGGDTRERHQRVMPDNSPFVDGNRRHQLIRGERRHQIPRPVEVGVHIAQVVVLVEELSDRLSVLGRRGHHLDCVGSFSPRPCAPGRGLDVVPPRSSFVTCADGHFCRQPLPVRTEVHQQHVADVRTESGERLGQRPELTSSARQRQAPVVHDDLDRSVTRVERDLDLAEVVVRVCVVKREADELMDDRAEPPLVLCRDSGSGCKRREECQYQRRRARVAEDGDLYPRHGKSRC